MRLADEDAGPLANLIDSPVQSVIESSMSAMVEEIISTAPTNTLETVDLMQ